MAFTPITSINISEQEYITNCNGQPYTLALYKCKKGYPVLLYQNKYYKYSELVSSNKITPPSPNKLELLESEDGVEFQYKNFYIRWARSNLLEPIAKQLTPKNGNISEVYQLLQGWMPTPTSRFKYLLYAKRINLDKSVCDEEIGQFLQSLIK